MRYRRHGKLEREGGCPIDELLLLLLRQELVLLVGWAAVPRDKGIHSAGCILFLFFLDLTLFSSCYSVGQVFPDGGELFCAIRLRASTLEGQRGEFRLGRERDWRRVGLQSAGCPCPWSGELKAAPNATRSAMAACGGSWTHPRLSALQRGTNRYVLVRT